MRAVVMDKFGGPDVLQLRQLDDPTPSAGQVLIDVEYASVTFVETQVRAGGGPAGKINPSLPRIPGNGVGGRIISVGADVDPTLIGAVVVSTTGGEGGYADRALAKATDAVQIPDDLELRDAVALLADGRTAVYLHRNAGIRAGERVLVLAAGGGVGSLLVQLAASSGARVVGAGGGPGKRDLVLSLGASDYVDYTTPDWTSHVSADVLFDGVGGQLGSEALTSLSASGRASIYGMASGAWSDTGSVTIVDNGGAPSPAEARSLIQEALSLAVAGRLRPIIGQIYPLSDAASAHRAIEARQTTGKTLLVS